MKAEKFDIRVDGSIYQIRALPDTPLLWILRDHLHLTGVKYGCGIGYCGNCMVLLNQKSQRSCQITISQLAPNDEIVTIAAMHDDVMALLRTCWIEGNVPQCGYCQSGMLIKAWEFVNQHAEYDEATLEQEFDRMLCRCGSYNRIKSAVRSAFDKRVRQS